MSYCRFIEADAYIYDDVYHGLYCCACALMPVRKADMSIFLGEEDDGEWLINEGFAAGYDYNKMLAHVAEHRAAGHYIPEDVDERLIEERDCEHVFVDMQFGIRCEKCWRPEDV
jgi:hypothetical protein